MSIQTVKIARFGLLLLLLGVTGCRVAQVQHDQDKARCALLNMYTNQLMDNLIRARNGYPIIQVDYTNVTTQVTQDATANFGGGQTVTDTRAAVFTRAIGTAFSYAITGRNANQVSMTANPVIADNEVYNAYLQFLAKPERLIETLEPPPAGAAHIVRCCEDKYYWIPVEFKYDFLRLALVTTAQRGQPLTVPEAFEKTIFGAVDIVDIPGKHRQHRLTLMFTDKLPNGSGILRADVEGQVREFEVEFYDKPIVRIVDGRTEELIVEYGDPIDRLDLVYSELDVPMSAQQLADQLKGQSVKIELEHFKPKIADTQQLLDAIRNEAQLIRLNQQL